jgi:hypothetical protein
VRRLVRLLLTIVLPVAVLLFSTGTAQAADRFNPFADSGVRTYTALGNCTVTVGPVQDPNGGTAQGTFVVIGGLHVACTARHHMRLYVAEYFRPAGGAWSQVGQTQSAQFYNTLTLGSRILQTTPTCGQGGKLSGSWYTKGWVYETDASGNVKTGYTVQSTPANATARAC